MLDRLGDNTPGDKGLSQSHFIGEQKSMDKILVLIHTTKNVVNSLALEVLEASQDL
jgi:hypothetical protein